MIRILIAEEAPLLRSGLVAFLGGLHDLEVVASIGSGERIGSVALAFRPRVALIDVDLPETGGFAAARALHESSPDCRTLLMAARRRPGDLRRAVTAPAAGLVMKNTSPDGLVAAIRRLAKGKRFVDPDLAFTELGAAQNPLTDRELEVLALASQGASAAQIAETLVLTIGTVRNHLSRINRKVGARNRVHAIRIAENAGWL
ncbi:response regulator transcription factor [Spirillospora sp. CA-294931]|uniref:response regulator transcription factor n=1 Tax=Spirillospora sp. CA-294931 TaxID=3240042 RepID=UPI003D8CB035